MMMAIVSGHDASSRLMCSMPINPMYMTDSDLVNIMPKKTNTAAQAATGQQARESGSAIADTVSAGGFYLQALFVAALDGAYLQEKRTICCGSLLSWTGCYAKLNPRSNEVLVQG